MEVPKVDRFFVFFVLDLLKDILGTVAKQQKKYGDIFQKKFLGQAFFFICHPKHAEQVLSQNQDNYLKHSNLVKYIGPIIGEDNLLVTNNLPQWYHDRDLAKMAFEAPVFFDRYAKQMTEYCGKILAFWEKEVEGGPRLISVDHTIDKIVLENIRTTLFDNIDLDVEEMIKHIPQIFRLAVQRSTSITKLPWIFPTKRKRMFQREIEFFHNEMKKVFRSRIKKNKDVDDVLGIFMHDSQIKDIGNTRCRAVESQVMTFNIVGFTTTSSTLKWILVMLMLHPELEKRIEAEVISVCNASHPTYADYANLKYTQAFIREVLRLYPAIPIVYRESKAADSLQGYSIPAHAGLIVSLFYIHRHKDYWDRPEEFDPDRFLSKPYGQDEPAAYMPFGAGRRGCLGKNFALMELTLITAMIVKRFRLMPPEGFSVEMEYIASMFIRPKLNLLRVQKK